MPRKNRIESYNNTKKDDKTPDKKDDKKPEYGQQINFTVHCNGSDIGNGVGIGNGNLNGGCCCSCGTTGHTGSTGITGFTGFTGGDPLVCESQCNLVCEQLYLTQTVSPTSVSRIGQELTWTFHATNISGIRITRPLVITSSVFGTTFLTNRGMDSGQTLKVIHKTIITSEDLHTSPLTSAAFVSYGIAVGVPGRYNPGTRVSPIVTTDVNVILPGLDIVGDIFVGKLSNSLAITLKLSLTNTGPLDIVHFSAGLGQIFRDCEPRIEPTEIPFMISDNRLFLKGGISMGETKSVTIIGFPCPECKNCCINGDPPGCFIDTEYNSYQGAIIFRAVRIPIDLNRNL